MSATPRRDDVIFDRFVNTHTHASTSEWVIILFLRIVPKLPRFRKRKEKKKKTYVPLPLLLRQSFFRKTPYVSFFMRVDNTQIAVVHTREYTHDRTRVVLRALLTGGIQATRDRIKRANYDKHDLNRRFI